MPATWLWLNIFYFLHSDRLISWEIFIKRLHHNIVSLVHLVPGGRLALEVHIPRAFLSISDRLTSWVVLAVAAENPSIRINRARDAVGSSVCNQSCGCAEKLLFLEKWMSRCPVVVV